MKTIPFALLVGLALPFQSIAQHDSSFSSRTYLTIGASYNEADVEAISSDMYSDSDIGATGSLGYSPNEYFSFELNYQDFGTFSDNPSGSNSSIAEATAIGLSAITRLSLNDRNYVSLNLGLNQLKVESFESSSFYQQEKDFGVSFGLSYDFFLYKEFSIGIDLKRYKADRFESDTSSLTFRYIFR